MVFAAWQPRPMLPLMFAGRICAPPSSYTAEAHPTFSFCLRNHGHAPPRGFISCPRHTVILHRSTKQSCSVIPFPASTHPDGVSKKTKHWAEWTRPLLTTPFALHRARARQRCRRSEPSTLSSTCRRWRRKNSTAVLFDRRSTVILHCFKQTHSSMARSIDDLPPLMQADIWTCISSHVFRCRISTLSID